MTFNESRLNRLLDQRRSDNSLRQLRTTPENLVDFSSNDYLGLSRSTPLRSRILKAYQEAGSTRLGSTGSRLLTGTSDSALATESFLAQLFGSPSALLFGSGYMANLAFFSAVPLRGDTIFYDELSHACIKDGVRLSLAQHFPFRHNDLNHLERKLKEARGAVFIACESMYSMDGDFAPLKDLVVLAQKYGARLVVDEAHSTGLFGNQGSGLVNALGLRNEVYAVIHTFGKAIGLHGACITGSETLGEFLVNFARPFIYTTAPGDFECLSIVEAFKHLQEQPELLTALKHNIATFENRRKHAEGAQINQGPIQVVLCPGNDQVKAKSLALRQLGFDVRPILSPTVKAGSERLRICLHSFNTEVEINRLCNSLNS